MQERYIPAVTMLSAGVVVSIFCVIKKVDTLYALKLLLGMLIVFYIVGLLVKRVIGKINIDVNQRIAEEKREEEENEEEQQEETVDEEIAVKDSQGMDE